MILLQTDCSLMITYIGVIATFFTTVFVGINIWQYLNIDTRMKSLDKSTKLLEEKNRIADEKIMELDRKIKETDYNQKYTQALLYTGLAIQLKDRPNKKSSLAFLEKALLICKEINYKEGIEVIENFLETYNKNNNE